MPWVFIFFIVIPIAEMALLIEVGGLLGVFPTIGLVMLTAVVGVSMLKRQGLSTLASFQQKSGQGELPSDELFAAVFLLLAGAFLLTPGFLTDAMGFALLFPQIRRALAKKVIAQGIMQMASGFQVHQSSTDTSHPFTSSQGSINPQDPINRPGPSHSNSSELNSAKGDAIDGEFIPKD